MLRVQRRAEAADGAASEVLALVYDDRKKSRLLARTQSGREVAIVLERGSMLRDGDLLAAEGGVVLRVVAAEESVSLVASVDALLLARAAYHLGNRHVPLQIEAGGLRYQHDHVLDGMMRELGLGVVVGLAGFQPEGGAYARGHSHPQDESARGHGHGYEHVHEHEHDERGGS
jgi:urease accessory protein